jgi:hypothetical protein
MRKTNRVRLLKVQYTYRQNTKAKPHLNNEGQECKTSLVKGRVLVEGGG